MTERSMRVPLGRWLLGALGVQPLAVALVARPEMTHVAAALEGRLVAGGGSWTPVSQPAILAFVAALGLIVAGLLFRRSEEHTSELQSRLHLVCRLLLEKKKKQQGHTAARYTAAH